MKDYLTGDEFAAAVEVFYVDGYAALLLLRDNFPLALNLMEQP